MFFLKEKIFPLTIEYNEEIILIRNKVELEEFIIYCNENQSYSKIKNIKIGEKNEK